MGPHPVKSQDVGERLATLEADVQNLKELGTTVGDLRDVVSTLRETVAGLKGGLGVWGTLAVVAGPIAAELLWKICTGGKG